MSRLKTIGQVTAAAGGAISCTVLVRRLSSQQSETSSELLCWVILPFLSRIKASRDINTNSRAASPSIAEPHHASSRSLWVVAACLTVASCFQAEIGTIGLLPALTPLLLIAEKQSWCPIRSPRLSDLGQSSSFIWGTAFVASLAVLTAPDRDSLGLILSVVPLACLVLVYIAFTPRSESTPYLPRIDIEEAILTLSNRVVVFLILALSLQMFAFGLSSTGIMSMLLLGFTKAFSWYFMIRMARKSSWSIATTIVTFSMVSTHDFSMLSSDTMALLQVIIAFLLLGQVIYMLPKQDRANSILWIFILVPLVPYLANIAAIRESHSLARVSFGRLRKHPVESLVQQAKTDFKQMLQRESKNYTAAYQEYERRYMMKPPPGFDAWYDFATSNESPIIDEFDVIFDMISPYWKLSGHEVTKAMSDTQNVLDVDLWMCTFVGEDTKFHCSHPSRTFDRNIELMFNTLMVDLSGYLPNVTFLVNHLDEPRILIPPHLLQRRALYDNGDFKVMDLSRQPTWTKVTKFCTSQSHNESTIPEHTVETFGLPFVANRSSTIDVCQHSEYSAMHGLFIKPTSFSLIEGLVPVLSTGSLSTMGDLLIPSPAYIEPGFRYNGAHDVDWDQKRNNLYWAGSTTGGFASDDSWRQYHRQRFVKMGQNLEKQNRYLRENDGVVSSKKSSFLNGRLFDVAFTRIFQCERKFCRDQRAYFKSKSWADKDRALGSRLVFDLDGNGISGRYYKLLASKSTPLKQTLLREWHDDRLVPWVHYVPVSQSLEELPELIFYLTSTEFGRQRAKEIAEQGREWFEHAFRDVDLSIYVYRLLLELARLQDPERRAS
ncbi:glycosyltransferase family 90 protein [Mollisia scopiformis]|uniref:Glycosyltransferase family 90 protein n=1 Tax=Mollisia scopiformis TaxID=149040 RepID=A0A194XT74_MOLSC|nr:glycosyltransferase family 90 protein [Mollisia scopiformis]KUJ23249.1 glycosyltransferase family 90 protein [Mollisia scopiformis]